MKGNKYRRLKSKKPMDYIFSIINPNIKPVYFGIAAILGFLAGGVAVHCLRRGRFSKTQSLALPILVMYVFLVFASTVFSRIPAADYSYELMPFWSYREILLGKPDAKSLFWEDVLNLCMLLPEGILLTLMMGRKDIRKPGLPAKVILIGFSTTLLIELLQLVLKRGLFEFDDIFHNTLGVTIGCLLCRLFASLRSHINLKR
jgi:glycopeptide antibiotics resistance protein